MHDHVQAARSYLTPPPHAFWTWDPDREVIRWIDGPTIAFRNELANVLELDVERGLPALTGIALLLSACRDSWSTDPPPLERVVDMLQHTEQSLDVPDFVPIATKVQRRDVRQLQRCLDQIHAIPGQMRRQLQTKAVLIQTLFTSDVTRASSRVAELVIEALRAGFPRAWLVQGDGVRPQHCDREASACVAQFLSRLEHFDVNAFTLRMQTGVEREVQPADLDEPLAARVRRLLEELQEDAELPGLARLTRSLMAVTSLPRPLQQPDDLSHGGVSDIANRGPLDRLLLSELANEDDVLTVRIATNEALYMRRETSTQTPPRHRLVLVDSGLRMWGVPRVFATSVALSLAALTDSRIAFTAYRSEGHGLVPIDLATREGVIEHLRALILDAHPGDALIPLREQLQSVEGDTDVILITGEDVLADPEFQHDLNELGADVRFLATVARSGAFRLRERTPHGLRDLREATFDLEQLLAPSERPSDPLIDPEEQIPLPAIFHARPFPLRLQAQICWEEAWSDDSCGVLSITDDHRLLWWDHSNFAPVQIAESLPSRKLHWGALRTADNRPCLVTGDLGRSQLWLNVVDLEKPACTQIPLEVSAEPIAGGFILPRSDVLCVMHPDTIELFSLCDGTHIMTVRRPSDCKWANGRFFRSGHRWCALSYDGVLVRFHDVVRYQEYADLCALTAMCDVDSIDGTVGVSGRDGRLYLTAVRAEFPLNDPLTAPIKVLAVSADGQRICVQHGCPPSENVGLIDVGRRQVFPVSRYLAFKMVRRPKTCRIEWGHRTCGADEFTAVAVKGQLFFLKMRSRVVLLTNDSVLDHIKLERRLPRPPSQIRRLLRPFRAMPTPSEIRYDLRRVEWPDGSCAILDSRGLLHLKSSDERLPEVTIVLSFDATAGWCSDGRVWGPPAALGERPSLTGSEIWNEVILPFMSRVHS